MGEHIHLVSYIQGHHLGSITGQVWGGEGVLGTFLELSITRLHLIQSSRMLILAYV